MRTSLFISMDDCKLKNYSAVTKGKNSTVRMEFQVSSAYSLAAILEECERAGKHEQPLQETNRDLGDSA